MRKPSSGADRSSGFSLLELTFGLALSGLMAVMVVDHMVKQQTHMKGLRQSLSANSEQMLTTSRAIGGEAFAEDLVDLNRLVRKSMGCEDDACERCNISSCEQFVLTLPDNIGRFGLEADCLNGLSVRTLTSRGMVELQRNRCTQFGATRSREIQKCAFDAHRPEKDAERAWLEIEARPPTPVPAVGPWYERATCAYSTAER